MLIKKLSINQPGPRKRLSMGKMSKRKIIGKQRGQHFCHKES